MTQLKYIPITPSELLNSANYKNAKPRKITEHEQVLIFALCDVVDALEGIDHTSSDAKRLKLTRNQILEKLYSMRSCASSNRDS